MRDLTERYHKFIDNYTIEHGHAPDKAVLDYGKTIVTCGNRLYRMGVSDARNNNPLPESFFANWPDRNPDVPADFVSDIADLMKYAYDTGWKDGGGVTV